MEQTPTVEDRIQLPLQFDVEKMLAEVRQMNMNNFIYYNVIPLRSPAHMVDPSLPVPPPTDDYADGSWTDWKDTDDLIHSPYLTEVIDTFKKHTKVTLVRILRLAAGNVVKEHCDPTLGIEIPKSVVRLTIPILNEEGVEFYLNGEQVPMKPGECWYMRLTDPHSVVNNSSVDRINLTIDMIPNDWVRSLIMG
ncbi:aspartyl/asparaginyl beta-hydroxylase domain-containing protein [Roseivirga sp.]|uniref:aspartyl/asparaginyl beta-hydroxylase domain-containing protein n=1 Tax=Roseivirga sp. TaxID=1964215 RepID=UPI003B517C00